MAESSIAPTEPAPAHLAYIEGEVSLEREGQTEAATSSLPLIPGDRLRTTQGRAEILFQFLLEAAFLTSVGGLLGIALGASIGWAVHLISGFPISLPWWSFALGLGFSAAVGIFFGMYPAITASRLDPIEALRYE